MDKEYDSIPFFPLDEDRQDWQFQRCKSSKIQCFDIQRNNNIWKVTEQTIG